MKTEPNKAPITRPAMRYHGSKFRLAPWVLGNFPPHLCYVESFGGAAGVLLQKPRAYAEVYNDLDGDMVNFFRVLQDPAQRGRLIELCELTPYAREEFEIAWLPTDDAIERARRTCIRAQMGFGSAGATKGTTGFRVDTKREYGTAQHLWADYPATIALVGARMTGVLVENLDASRVMHMHDAPSTLHFVDPPYMHSTRSRTVSNSRGYRHEMSDTDHVALISSCRTLSGMVVLCGYPSTLYDDALGDWGRRTTTARAAGQRGTSLRTEVLWLNPACSAALEATRAQPRMFA